MYIFDKQNTKYMNFQTNKHHSIKFIDQTQASICPSGRIKTCVSDGSDNDAGKRFQRSQNKRPTHDQSGASLTNRARIASIEENGENQTERKGGESMMIRSVVREINLQQPHISKQKFIPFTMRELKLKESVGVSGYAECKSVSLRELDKTKAESTKNQLKIEQNKSRNFPFRTIISQNQNDLKKSQILTQEIPTGSQIQKETIKNPLKSLFQKHIKTISYAQIANTSTQSSIPQIKKSVRKLTFGCQTQNKKMNNAAVNTVNTKNSSTKVQTDQTGSTFNKVIDDLKNKLAIIQDENKKLKVQISSISKEKQDLSRQLRQNKQNYEKSYKSVTINRNPKDAVQYSSYKQISLQESIVFLKKQIEALKSGLGIKKVQQVIQSIKRQNSTLISQIQAVSLKCRVLEQQNNQMSCFEQQNRKLKVQIKYFRGSVKDHQMQIERLKNENKKLRNVPKMNGNLFQDSRIYSGWGSQTDSLNLSVSFIRD